MPEGREALLQVLGRLQGKRAGEIVRDAMTEYEAMRIDQDRDPIVTDQVMRRFLATGAIRRDVQMPEGGPPDRRTSWPRASQVQALAAQVYARSLPAKRADARASSSASLESLADVRGRKSLVLVSGGLVQDTRLRRASAAW